ncbi:hypothetical protein PpBr36_00089, partial [Pyricularia pennisetigena]|uniref:hypothetical protein n=1 Tax=Pyricularia pennisetigena TaxID=1578925 RepID=UPI00114F2E16
SPTTSRLLHNPQLTLAKLLALAVSFSSLAHSGGIVQDANSLADSYDYVIAGGGTAGLTLGDRRSEDGKNSVLVAECGDLGCQRHEGKMGIYWHPQFSHPQTATRSFSHTGHWDGTHRDNYEVDTRLQVISPARYAEVADALAAQDPAAPPPGRDKGAAARRAVVRRVARGAAPAQPRQRRHGRRGRAGAYFHPWSTTAPCPNPLDRDVMVETIRSTRRFFTENPAVGAVRVVPHPTH